MAYDYAESKKDPLSHDIREMFFPEAGDRLMGIWLKLVKSKVLMGCIQCVNSARESSHRPHQKRGN
ncbi:hypothetical protein LRP30_30750 [Bradyrhizobium sp. C-145]|uniref:hypothetical protein n=1 Tax=Bradyrhizobium sp. C-145 TaxID=574727 RepID=UPI00201B7E41|nr:hypothetical protein [Bradyrhizobium sp. C-145]UQR61303.1 hypothetical protein LRP30_30750 [Bradyrhizobium sp. C-145]